MYWDDDPKNVEIAKSQGIDARFYTESDFLIQIKNSLNQI